MMSQRWDALMASVGIDKGDWDKKIGQLGADLARWEDQWDGLGKISAQSMQAINESLGNLQDSIKLTASEQAKMNRIFAAYDDMIAQTDAQIADRIRAERKMAAEIIAAEDKTQQNQQEAAAAQEKADAERHAAREREIADTLRVAEAEEELARQREANRQRFIAAGNAIDAHQKQQMANAERAVNHEQRLREAREAAAARAVAEQNRIQAEQRQTIQGILDMENALEALAWESAHTNATMIRTGAQHRGIIRRTGEEIRRGTMMWFEFGRAIEDASIGYSLNGIKGLVMGASNNLARMAEMAGSAGGALARMGPWLAIGTSIASAVYMIWQNMEGAKKATEEEVSELDKLIDRLTHLQKLRGNRERAIIDVEDLESVDDARDMIARLDRQIREAEAGAQPLTEGEWEARDKLREFEQQKAAIEEEIALISQRAAAREAEAADFQRLRELEGDRAFANERIAFYTDAIAKAAELVAASDEDILQLDLQRNDALEREQELLEQVAHDKDKIAATIEREQKNAAELVRLEQERVAAAERLIEAQEEIERQQQRDRENLDRQMFNMLATPEDRLREDRSQRDEIIESDRSLSIEDANARLAQSADIFNQQMAELFDIERLGELESTLAGLSINGEIVQDQYVNFANAIEELRLRFESGDITLDEFNSRVEHLDRTFNELAQAAEEAAEAERRAALLRGDWEGAGLSVEEALQERRAQEMMRQFNSMVDDAYRNLYGPSQEEMDQWVREMERMQRAAHDAADTFAQFQGDPEESIGALWAFINSLDGQIANTENSLMLMQSTLDRFGDSMDVLRKQELRTSIENLTAVLNDLYEQQRQRQFISEINGAAFITDPGLQTPDGRDTRSTTAGRGGVTLEFPNLTRLGNAEVGSVSDKLMEENRRRGVRAFT